MGTSWGILGTGTIARAFAEGLRDAEGAELVAVGSRARATADAFAAEVGAARAYASYEGLVQDDGVDVVYIATPHAMHRPNTLLALEAGKHVLCEKPFALNAVEAGQMVAAARERGLFLMEAMWTRFFPIFGALRERLAAGAIGQPRFVSADFGFRVAREAGDILFDPSMGGGALLDVGIYPLSLASMVFGPATDVATLGQIGPTGVDEQAVIALAYANGGQALVHCGFTAETRQQAVITGTEGRFIIETPWWRPSRMVVTQPDGEVREELDLPYRGNGYGYEAEEVGRCLAAGRTESEVVPLGETMELMSTMDSIRARWGLVYPSERIAQPSGF